MNHSSTPSLADATPDVFRELGVITRQLHDTLTHLGYMPKLQDTVEGLPDARSRLTYIANKTGEAAEKVLNSVDKAKQDYAGLLHATQALGGLVAAGTAGGEVAKLVGELETRANNIDGHLTDIMMAQDFHDLTNQVVAKVVSIVLELEGSLVNLLVRSAPSELGPEHAPAQALSGPVVNPEGRTDVVSNQSEVDDLLASMGF